MKPEGRFRRYRLRVIRRPDDALKPGVEMEYAALRSEILKRIELRHQFVTTILTLAGVFLGVGVSIPLVAFVYPPLATFLAAGWTQNEIRIRHLGEYIRERFESSIPGLGWETFWRQKALETRLGLWSLSMLSTSGIFLVTQLMAVGFGLFKFTSTPLEWVLLGIDCIAILFLFVILRKVRLRSGA